MVGPMNLFKLAALVAIATLPLLLSRKEKELKVIPVESDHLFDEELSAG